MKEKENNLNESKKEFGKSQEDVSSEHKDFSIHDQNKEIFFKDKTEEEETILKDREKFLFDKHPHLILKEISTSKMARDTIVATLESKLFSFFAQESFNNWIVPRDILAAAFIAPANSFLNNHIINSGELHSLVGAAMSYIMQMSKVSEPGEVKQIYPEVAHAVINAAYEVLRDRNDIDDNVKASIFDSLFVTEEDVSPWSFVSKNQKTKGLKAKHTFVYSQWYDYMIKTISGKNYITAAPTIGVIADFIKTQKEKGHLANLKMDNMNLASILHLVKDIQHNTYNTDILNAIKSYELATNWVTLLNAQSPTITSYISMALYLTAGTEVVPIPAFLTDKFILKTDVWGENSIVQVKALFGKPIEMEEGIGLDFVSDISLSEWLSFTDAALNNMYQPESIWSILDLSKWGADETSAKEKVLDYFTYWRRSINQSANVYTPQPPTNIIKLIEIIGRYIALQRLFTGKIVNQPFSVKGAMQYERTSFENFEILDRLLSVVYTLLDSYAEATFLCIGIGLGYFKRMGADLTGMPEISSISREIYSTKASMDLAKLLTDTTLFKNFRKSISDTIQLRIKRAQAALDVRRTMVLEILSNHLTWMPIKTSIVLPDPFPLATKPFSEEQIYNSLIENWKSVKPKTFRESDDLSKYSGYLVLMPDNELLDKGKFGGIKNTIYMHANAGLVPHVKNPRHLIEMADITTFMPFNSVETNTMIIESDSDMWKLGRDVRYDLVSRVLMVTNSDSDSPQTIMEALFNDPTYRRLIEKNTLKLIPTFSYVNLASEIGLDLSPNLFIKKFPALAKEWFTDEAMKYFAIKKNSDLSVFVEEGEKKRELKSNYAVFLSKPLEDMIILKGSRKPYTVIDILDESQGLFNKVRIIFGDTVKRPYFYQFTIDKVFLEKTSY